MAVSYLAKDQKLDAARLHAETAKTFDIEYTVTQLNNYGYLQLALGNLNEAQAALSASIEKAGNFESSAALPYYNRGVLEAMRGNVECAVEDFRSSLRISEAQFLPENKHVTVFVPSISESGTVEMKEHPAIDLLDAVRSALSVLENSGEKIVDQGEKLVH